MSKEVKFEKAAFGYRPEDVDRYVEESEKKIAAAKAEKTEMLGKMKILADKISEYRSDESNLKEAMVGAQRMKASIETEAKEKADAIINEAREYAKKLLTEAQAKSTEMLSNAKEKSTTMVAEAEKTAADKVNGVTDQVEAEKETLAQLQQEVAAFKNRLIALYREHLNLITNLPEKAEKIEAPAEPEEAPAQEEEAEEYAFNSSKFKEKFGEVEIKE